MKALANAILLLALLVAFSRLYLQVHWPSDVAAGGLVAMFWTSIVTVFVSRFQRSARSR
ncbi:phosphatase PAP2 family protein [Kineobactrum salinum]|uniref:Phosphatase PAP2 family protein n=1 Tax=Kineobactrum salinum TaxID=2708301 RepID=A0A6C0U754_9GAMM|nr:phosphatase PAP2 family protein [Kineobactrum salinum]